MGIITGRATTDFVICNKSVATVCQVCKCNLYINFTQLFTYLLRTLRLCNKSWNHGGRQANCGLLPGQHQEAGGERDSHRSSPAQCLSAAAPAAG